MTHPPMTRWYRPPFWLYGSRVCLTPCPALQKNNLAAEDGRAESEGSSVLIRGLKAAEFHKDAAQPTLSQLRRAGFCATITGGGRIKHDSARRSIFVYGCVASGIEDRPFKRPSRATAPPSRCYEPDAHSRPGETPPLPGCNATRTRHSSSPSSDPCMVTCGSHATVLRV